MNTYLLQHLLMNTAQRYPDKEAIIFNERSITYDELEKWSNQLALALSELGVRVGDRVGIMLNKSIESIISLLGILKAGAAYVPIDPRAPVSRVKYVIKNCEIECLITSFQNVKKFLSDLEVDSPLKKVVVTERNGKQLSELNKHVEFIGWEKISEEISKNYQSINMADVNPAYILYTSGSTGVPKGVVISHLNSLTFVNMAAEFFSINGDDRLCNFAPLHFDLSIFDIFVAVKSAATIVLIPEYLSTFPLKLAEYINEKRISVWNSVSSVLTMLAERGKLEKLRFDSLRIVHFSGDILPVKYLRFLKKQMENATFYNIYGQTEANSSMSYQIGEIPDNDAWKIPIGKAFPNFEVFALDGDNGIIKSPNLEGELYVRASTVASGYWGDSERTAMSFIQDPRQPGSSHRIYKTGDLVQMDKDGNYYFIGRKDHMIKSRGYRIELNEIESVLNSHPLIRQAAVIAIPDELIGNRIIAYISSKEGVKLEEREILNHCGKLISKYMLPEKIVFQEELPKTSTGKLDRKLLTKDAQESGH